jgi:hypothetical protein
MWQVELPLVIPPEEVEWVLGSWNWKETLGKVSGQWNSNQRAYFEFNYKSQILRPAFILRINWNIFVNFIMEAFAQNRGKNAAYWKKSGEYHAWPNETYRTSKKQRNLKKKVK